MSRALSDLEPVTRLLADQFLNNCHSAGVDIIVTCTLRTFAEQDALYAQGRTLPGHIVTKAQAGQSPHNFGLALDVVPVVSGKPVWEAAHPIWKQVGFLGVSAGLEWGGDFAGKFKDAPHFQRPHWREHINASTQSPTT